MYFSVVRDDKSHFMVAWASRFSPFDCNSTESFLVVSVTTGAFNFLRFKNISWYDFDLLSCGGQFGFSFYFIKREEVNADKCWLMAVLNCCKFAAFWTVSSREILLSQTLSFSHKMPSMAARRKHKTKISLKCINYFFLLPFSVHFSGDIEKSFICRLVLFFFFGARVKKKKRWKRLRFRSMYALAPKVLPTFCLLPYLLMIQDLPKNLFVLLP